MTRWFNNKGFTLTELIVVITVIGILMGGVALSMTGHASRARDNRRKTDLQQIKSALEFYRSDNTNGIYPQSALGAVSTRYIRTVGGVKIYELEESGQVESGEMPIDPLSTATTEIDYVYTALPTGCTNAVGSFCTSYTLTATNMETEAAYTVTPLSTN